MLLKWHFLLFQIILCTVKAYLFRTVTMNSEDHTFLCTFTIHHLFNNQPTDSLQLITGTLSRHWFSQSSAHSISCQKSTYFPCTSRRSECCLTNRKLKLDWILFSGNLCIRSFILSIYFSLNHFARSTCGSAPQTECISFIYWYFLYISGCVYVVLFHVYSVFVYACILTSTWVEKKKKKRNTVCDFWSNWSVGH